MGFNCMTGNQLRWKVVFDSVQGTSHERNNQPCQDCSRVVKHQVAEEEILIAVCADGAGSSTHSAEGARIVCDEFVKLGQSYLNEQHTIEEVSQEIILSWLKQIRSEMLNEADQLQTELSQMASTFLGCIITPQCALFIQIGDGAMIYKEAEQFQYAFWPHSGEYINMTNFLTSDKYQEQVEWKIITKQIDEFAAFTDGLERLVLNFEKQFVHEPAVVPMLNALRSSETGEEFFDPLRSFLNSKNINERTDDDKTLVLATRLNNEEPVL
ncbi:PP2C family serine/threonine-protein phosphatase [Gimesia chilikensis]|nr:PP2C family serine/threonine-protein phosphatase [Gimesia chilikensis]